VLGGKTGTGKTQVLRELASKGEQILDLEKIAHHKGSAFGWIGESAQLPNEQFENEVFEQLRFLDTEKVIWIENESRKIGKNYLPDWLWEEMKVARLIQIHIDVPSRIQHLIETYKSVDKNNLKVSFTKIRKKIGFLQEQNAIAFIEQNNLEEAVRIALQYYDSCYTFGFEKSISAEISEFTFDHTNFRDIALALLEYKTKLLWEKQIKSG
jgi:tRNA 2-selenouridine synthase